MFIGHRDQELKYLSKSSENFGPFGILRHIRQHAIGQLMPVAARPGEKKSRNEAKVNLLFSEWDNQRDVKHAYCIDFHSLLRYLDNLI